MRKTILVLLCTYIFHVQNTFAQIAITSYPVPQTNIVCRGETFQAFELKFENITTLDSIKLTGIDLRNSNGSVTNIDSLYITDTTSYVHSKERMINGNCTLYPNIWIKNFRILKIWVRTTTTGSGSSWAWLDNVKYYDGLNNGYVSMQNLNFVNQPWVTNCSENMTSEISVQSDNKMVRDGDTVILDPNPQANLSIGFNPQKILWYLNDSLLNGGNNTISTWLSFTAPHNTRKVQLRVLILGSNGEFSRDTLTFFLKPRMINVTVGFQNFWDKYSSLYGKQKTADTICLNNDLIFHGSVRDYPFENSQKWYLNDSLIVESFVQWSINKDLMSLVKPGINKLIIKVQGVGIDTGSIAMFFFTRNRIPANFTSSSPYVCSAVPLPFTVNTAFSVKSIITDPVGIVYFNGNTSSLQKGGNVLMTINWSNGCTTDTTLQLLEAISPQKPSIAATGCTVITNSTPSGSDQYTYQWFWNNDSITNSNSKSIVSKNAGVYHCVVSNQYGCTAQSDLLSVNCGTAGINNIQHDLVLNSNPIRDELFVSSPRNENFIVVDMTGRKVLESKTNQSTSTSHLNPGVYFLETDKGSRLKFLKN